MVAEEYPYNSDQWDYMIFWIEDTISKKRITEEFRFDWKKIILPMGLTFRIDKPFDSVWTAAFETLFASLALSLPAIDKDSGSITTEQFSASEGSCDCGSSGTSIAGR